MAGMNSSDHQPYSVFAKEVMNPEGPVSLKNGGWIVTSMDTGSLICFSEDGKSRSDVGYTELPNGLALDLKGNVWVAEAARPALLMISKDGTVTEISRGPEHLPFLLPNDLCFGPDGWLYLTDSGLDLATMRALTPSQLKEAPFDGRLYRIHPLSGKCEVLDRGLRLTNGIAFGLSGQELYVAETLTGNIYRYRVGVWQREIFGNVLEADPSDYDGVAGPDGIAFDNMGHLYVAVLVQGDITVLDERGKVYRRIPVPGNRPTNLAFDRSGRPVFLVTDGANNQLLLYRNEQPGASLYYGEPIIQ